MLLRGGEWCRRVEGLGFSDPRVKALRLFNRAPRQAIRVVYAFAYRFATPSFMGFRRSRGGPEKWFMDSCAENRAWLRRDLRIAFWSSRDSGSITCVQFLSGLQ